MKQAILSKMPKISVIIPVYNVENFLDICLDTIIMQTFQDFEVICIDDGSSDKSFELLQKYEKFDNRIKILKQENKGAAAARNKGLEIAQGDYLLFIDADDYISPVMFEKLYSNAIKYNSDMITSNLLWITTETNEGFTWGLTEENKAFFNIINKPFFDGKNNGIEVFFSIIPTVSAKLLKRDYIKDLKFAEGLIFEDNLYFTECYFRANKISYDTNSYYYYRQQPNSVMRTCDARFKDIFKVKRLQEDICKKYGVYEKFKTELLIQKMQETIERTITAQDDIQEEMFSLLKEEFKDFDYSDYDIKKISKVENFYTMEKIIRMDFREFSTLAKQLKEKKNG